MPIPLSVQLWSLRDHMQNGQHIPALTKLARLGYRGVECGDLFGMQPEDFRALVESSGLAISGWHQQLPKPADAAEVARRTKALGIDQVTFAWTDPARWASLEKLRSLADEIEASRSALSDHGVTLIYHNHDHEIRPIAGRMGLSHLLGWLPGLRMEIDTYWAANFGDQDPAAVVREFRVRSPLLHIKDGPLTRGAPQVAVGSGRMDIPAVVAAADPTVTRWLVVELDECATDMWQAVAESYRYLVGHGLASGTVEASVARQAR